MSLFGPADLTPALRTDHGSSLLADAVAAHLLERESLQKSVADGR